MEQLISHCYSSCFDDDDNASSIKETKQLFVSPLIHNKALTFQFTSSNDSNFLWKSTSNVASSWGVCNKLKQIPRSLISHHSSRVKEPNCNAHIAWLYIQGKRSSVNRDSQESLSRAMIPGVPSLNAFNFGHIMYGQRKLDKPYHIRLYVLANKHREAEQKPPSANIVSSNDSLWWKLYTFRNIMQWCIYRTQKHILLKLQMRTNRSLFRKIGFCRPSLERFFRHSLSLVAQKLRRCVCVREWKWKYILWSCTMAEAIV